MAAPLDLSALARSDSGQRMVNVTVNANCRVITLPTWCRTGSAQFYTSLNAAADGDFSDEVDDQTDGDPMVQPYQTAYNGAPVAWRVADEGRGRKSAPQIVIGGRAGGDTCTLRLEG